MSSSTECFCAFCKSERRIYHKRHLSFLDASLAVGASFMLMLLIWQDFDPRVCVFIALALGLTEFFIIGRRRLSMACRRCGFDPMLYKKNPAQAAERVKAFMANRREDPLALFTAQPQLPVLRKRPHEATDLHPDVQRKR